MGQVQGRRKTVQGRGRPLQRSLIELEGPPNIPRSQDSAPPGSAARRGWPASPVRFLKRLRGFKLRRGQAVPDDATIDSVLARSRSASRMRKAYLSKLGVARQKRSRADRRAVDFTDTAPPGTSDFRASFLQKLSYEGVWLPQLQKPPRHRTVIIFDWDDTLLCTSALVSAAPAWRPRGVERAAAKLMELSQRFGRTFVITNSVDGWVEETAQKYIPGILPALQEATIISARHAYEALYPESISEWKRNAFLDVQSRLAGETVTNLISIGDSQFEMNAALALGRRFPSTVVKTVKLREEPSAEELQKELALVTAKLPMIVTAGRDLRIGIGPKF